MPPRKSSSRAAARTPSSAARARPSSRGAPAAATAPTATTSSAVSAAKDVIRSISLEREEAFSSLNPAVNEIVPPSALKNLKNYQYSTIDHSLMQKYCGIHKYWDFVVSFVPYWVAPNMLTMLALFCSMSYPLLIMYLENTFLDEANPFLPKWVWLFSAVALFAYQTLDSIDGKHARRTGAKGPLGEMFDHGCDALFTPFMLYASCRCLHMGPSQTYLFCLVSTFTLYATIFEQFLTGTFILPAVNGPTEGVILSVGLYLWTYFKGGSQWWATKFLSGPITAPLPKTLVSACTINGKAYLDNEILIANTYGDVAFVLFIVLAIITAVTTVRSAFFRLTGENKSTLCNFATHIFVLAVWSLFAFVYPDTAYGNAREFSILFGIYFAFAASDLTVHRLVQLPARLSNKMLLLCLAYPLAKLIVFRNRHTEGSPMCALGKLLPADLAILMTGCYIFYLLSVFNQFGRGLGVNVVTLTEQQLKVSEAEAFKRNRN